MASIDGATDPVRDYTECRYLMRTLFSGLKQLIIELAQTTAQINPSQKPMHGSQMQMQAHQPKMLNEIHLSPSDMKSIYGIIPHGISCLVYFQDNDCNDLMEQMADMLSVIPPRNMIDTFSYKMSYMSRPSWRNRASLGYR